MPYTIWFYRIGIYKCGLDYIWISMQQSISIIIPTYNEAAVIGTLINYLEKWGGQYVKEIIICDGGSIDETIVLAKRMTTTVLTSPQKGRAAQMNFGATNSTGSILYFIHADSIPPTTFASDIIKAVNAGYDFGRYRTKFDSHKFLLKINAWFTRFNWFICYGGDQTLFITRNLFEQSGGFKNELLIMEEYEFANRLMKKGRYKIFSKTALVSARKYEGRSWLKVQSANRKAVSLFRSGAAQDVIVKKYNEILG